jgi:hypothetical protein
MGRISMSDAPSMALVALGLWLFWHGLDGSRARYWLAAGFVAGASLLLREANVLLFVPLFAGVLIRREAGVAPLVVGGLLGVGTRLLSGYLAYGDPFFYKSPGVVFSLGAVPGNLLLYGFALLVLAPGGLIAAFAYRGRRRPELVISISGFLLLYLLYAYTAAESGVAKQLVLGLRFMLPVLPLVAFAMAEAIPRLWQRWLTGASPEARVGLARVGTTAAMLWIAGVGIAAGAVHPLHAGWGRAHAELRRAIGDATRDAEVVITNWSATSKYIDLVSVRYLPLDRTHLGPEAVAALLRRHGEAMLVLLDRSDSQHWRDDARANADFLETLPGKRTIVFDRQVTATDTLRVWRVSADTAAGMRGRQ